MVLEKETGTNDDPGPETSMNTTHLARLIPKAIFHPTNVAEKAKETGETGTELPSDSAQ